MSTMGEQSSRTDQLRGMASDVKENLKDVSNAARDMAQEKLGEAREVAGQYYQQGRERAQALEQNLETYIKEQPVTSIMVAAGVGFLIGVLWSR